MTRLVTVISPLRFVHVADVSSSTAILISVHIISSLVRLFDLNTVQDIFRSFTKILLGIVSILDLILSLFRKQSHFEN